MASKYYIWIAILFLSMHPEVDAAPLDKMIDLANEGNVEAQMQLGVIYATENGSDAHLEEAKKWLIKAAHGGSVEAEYNLGVIYSGSEKNSQDYSQAYYWFEQAANKGNRDAQYNLGVMYIEGLGVKSNPAEAEKWFLKSVVNGTPADQYELGVIYKEGTRLPQDYHKALFWFETAAAYGHMMAQYEVGLMYGEGIGGERNYVKSLEWLHKSAQQGNNIADYAIEVIARKGLGWQDKAIINASMPPASATEQLSLGQQQPSPTDEYSTVFEALENLSDSPTNETVAELDREADGLTEDIVANEQSNDPPDVASIAHCEFFVESKNKSQCDDERKDENIVEQYNEKSQSAPSAYHDFLVGGRSYYFR